MTQRHKGSTGTAMTTVKAGDRKRRAAARRAQERAWAAKAGPVTVRYVEPTKTEDTPTNQ